MRAPRVTLVLVALFFAFTALETPSLTPVIAKAQQPNKVLYLTFDDGPSERYTPRVLDVLRQYHVSATFFVLGNRCESYPRIVRRIHLEGHEIGSHGYDHQFIVHQSADRIVREVKMADQAVYRTCGIRPVYYRPPGGLADQQERDTILKLGHPIALWTVDSMDWKAKSDRSIVTVVERDAHPGSIVLFHDGVSGSRFTVRALPVLIVYFQKKGYRFCRLPSSSP